MLNDFFVIHLELVGVRAFRFYWELTIRFSMTIFQNDTLCYPAESLVNLNASIGNLYLSAQQQRCSGFELCISKNLFVIHESSQPATILNENNSIFLIFICLYIFTDVFRDVDSITVRAVHIDRNTHSIKRSNYPASKWKEKNENHFDKSGEWSQKTITITSEVRWNKWKRWNSENKSTLANEICISSKFRYDGSSSACTSLHPSRHIDLSEFLFATLRFDSNLRANIF